MSNPKNRFPAARPIEFVPFEGSRVLVGRRDKPERIREAIVDLQLVIDGLVAQEATDLGDVVASLARHCSIFLRKMVHGDDRSPHLLDDETCRDAGLALARIRRIPNDRRTLSLVPVHVLGGYMQATKLDDDTREPEATHVIPIAPQRLSIAVEWPLPGMADWVDHPTPESAWEVRPEGLFASEADPGLCRDRWLGQQLVLFDDRGITLKDVIRVTVNTEGAHSPPLHRLMLSEGAEDKTRFRVVKDRKIHILSHITVCGMRYTHVIVIQAALHLYSKLAQNKSVNPPGGPVKVPVFGFVPTDVFAPDQRWLRFDGGLAMAFGAKEQSISHKVRAPR